MMSRIAAGLGALLFTLSLFSGSWLSLTLGAIYLTLVAIYLSR